MSNAQRRALIAGFVLAAFYVTTFLTALLSLALGAAWTYWSATQRAMNALFLIAISASSAGITYGLLRGLLLARPTKFTEPGRRITREDAPRLFAMLDELAHGAGIETPQRVYLGLGNQMSVTETATGFFGQTSERVVLVGAGYIQHTSVRLLRSILAHELGHFAGGDTRWTGLVSFTENAFTAVLESTHRSSGTSLYRQVAASASRAVGMGMVRLFVRLYLRLAQPLSRAQELEADRLSAHLAGREAARQALREASVFGPLYQAFLGDHLLPYLTHQVCPSDLTESFLRFRARLEQRGKLEELTRAVHEAKTNPFDSHPSLSDRLRMLDALPEGPSYDDDGERGTALFAAEFEFDTWYPRALAEAVLAQPVPTLRRMPMDQMVREVIPVEIAARAARVRERLARWYPHALDNTQMFAAAIDAIAGQRVLPLGDLLEPGIAQLPGGYQRDAAIEVVLTATTSLFEAALLDCGAAPRSSLGETCRIFELHGEQVRPGDLVLALPKEPAAGRALATWSARLQALTQGQPFGREIDATVALAPRT